MCLGCSAFDSAAEITSQGFAGRGDVAAATQRLYKAEKKLKKKRTVRAQKWRSNMLKTFADVDVKSIDSEVLSRGREYIDMLKK